MPEKTVEINGFSIAFDKERTFCYRTGANEPCDCQDCRNYYENVERNAELVAFLADFGIEYRHAEEVLSWDWPVDEQLLIRSEAYYGVVGQIEEKEFSIEKCGVKITFAKDAYVPHDRIDNYFWIIVEADFPYILDEKRGTVPYKDVNALVGLVGKLKTLFVKKQKQRK